MKAQTVCNCIVALTLAAVAMGQEAPPDAFNFYVQKTSPEGARSFRFVELRTQEVKSGFHETKSLLDARDIREIELDAREVGGAPVTGIVISLLVSALPKLEHLIANEPNAKLVFRFDGDAKCVIAASELKRVVLERGTLWVLIPVNSAEEFSLLKKSVLRVMRR